MIDETWINDKKTNIDEYLSEIKFFQKEIKLKASDVFMLQILASVENSNITYEDKLKKLIKDFKSTAQNENLQGEL